jgi:hypothetical protein
MSFETSSLRRRPCRRRGKSTTTVTPSRFRGAMGTVRSGPRRCALESATALAVRHPRVEARSNRGMTGREVDQMLCAPGGGEQCSDLPPALLQLLREGRFSGSRGPWNFVPLGRDRRLTCGVLGANVAPHRIRQSVPAFTLEAICAERVPRENFVTCWVSSLFPHHEPSPLALAVTFHPIQTNMMVETPPPPGRK